MRPAACGGDLKAKFEVVSNRKRFSNHRAFHALVCRYRQRPKAPAGCMAERGYLSVPEEQAEVKAQELAALAAEKARREAALTPKPVVSKKPQQSQAQSTPKISASPTQ
jgi:hypothetical protein